MKRAFALLLFASLLSSVSLLAQTDRATIVGTVTDSSGAVIPGVNVAATNTQTKVETTATTNDTGFYRILNLPIGEYSISFTKQDFQTLERKGIDLSIGQVAEINVSLAIGKLAQAVQVTAAAPILQSQTSDLGSTMGNQAVNDLPLDITGGRELENFAYAIVPGVEGNNWTSYISGTPAFSKQVLIDGTLQQGSETGSVDEDYPPMDAVQEFKVTTGGTTGQASAYTAGGTFMFSLRSGTNKFHGSAFDYMQNEAFNANTWMNNYCSASGACTPADFNTPYNRQNDYGFSGGGPIIKDKTFIFAAFEHYNTQNYTLGAYNRTVPTAAFLNGDFGALLDKNVQLGTDPGGNLIYKGAIFNPVTGLVFPDNQIPSSMFSDVAKKIIPIYQKYYAPQTTSLINNDAATNLNNPWFHQTQFSVKVDHNISDKDRLSGSFIFTDRPRILADTGDGVWDNSLTNGGPLAQSRYQDVTSRSLRLSQSYNFTPNLLNVASFTYLRYRNPSTSEAADGNWPQQLGFGDTGAGNFPEISFGSAVNGVAESSIGYSSAGFYVSNIYVGDDALTWIKGRHTLTFGGELRAFQLNSEATGGMLGFNFSNAQTGAPTASYSNQVGFGFASFLLGDVQSASEAVPYALYGRRKELSLYSTDSWKFNSKLTLTMGLNWNLTMPWYEKYGHWSNFDTQQINPTLGIPGVLDFAGNGGKSFEGPVQWGEFGPNLGIAYQVTPHIVARAAYAMYYEPVGSNYWSGVPYGSYGALGYVGTNQIPQTNNFAPAFNWDSGYPGLYVPPTLDPNYLQWGMVSVSPQSLVLGRIQQWNAGVEMELTNNTRLSVNYLSNRGSRLHDGGLQSNQPDPVAYSNLLKSGHEWDWVWDPSSAAAAGVPYPYPGYSNESFMALSPFPQVATQWGPLYYVGSPLGISAYDSFQAEIVHRTSRGLTADVSYNFGHQITNAGQGQVFYSYGNFQETWSSYSNLQDPINRSYAANYIQPWNQSILKGYIGYELPFGEGHRFLGNNGSAVNAAVSGWRLGWTMYYSTGTPLAVWSNNYYPGWYDAIYTNVASGADLASHFGSGAFTPPTGNAAPAGDTYFNAKAFSNPSYGDYGNAGPYTAGLKGFGNAAEDLGIYKEFRFRERFNLQLRGEFFNAFNRHYFSNPVTDIGSPFFGSAIAVGGQPRYGQVGLRFQW
jgi:Carboxypeptidase regulatory-like domain